MADPRFALGMVLAFAPAWGTVVRGGGSGPEDAAIRVRAHRDGARETCVVGLEYLSERPPTLSLGTGVYLGLDRDGARGLVLTAAHLFVEPVCAPPAPAALHVTFGPDLGDAGGVTVPVRRIILHPGFKYYEDPAPGDAGPMAACDLALLEFDATKVKEDLARKGVRPAQLYEGTGWRRPLLEAKLAGFGLFATHTDPCFRPLGKVHAGYTRVTYGAWRGREGFMHWSPLSRSGLLALGSRDPFRNPTMFLMVEETTAAVDPFTSAPIPIRSHPRQAMGALGDSGGPLFFNTRQGLRLAGIYSMSLVEPLPLPGSPFQALFLVDFWEPLMDHAPWLRSVREGDVGQSRVLEVGAPR